MRRTVTSTYAVQKLAHYSSGLCSECGSILPKGKQAIGGFTSDGRAIYAGDCCERLISEKVLLAFPDTSYKRPALNTALWRYLDFSKFVGLLQSRALYFARADTLGDPFEAAAGLSSRETEYYSNLFRAYSNGLKSLSDELGPEHALFPESDIEKHARGLVKASKQVGAKVARTNYVSCWHASEYESEALWRTYAPPPSAGVALRTTFGKLDNALLSEELIKFGHVNYVDYSNAFAGLNDRIFCKRISLSHENEVRAVLEASEMTESDTRGICVQWRVNEAIDAFVVSPFAPDWFFKVTKDLVEKYEVHIPIVKSELSAQPFT